MYDFHSESTFVSPFFFFQKSKKVSLGTQLMQSAIYWSEKAMAPHSSTFAWKIPWTEEPGRLQSMGSLESDTTEWLHFHFSLSCIGEGNGTPLQCSCLENPRDGGAWWAAIYGVAQSRTRLKQLSSSSSSTSYSSGLFMIDSFSVSYVENCLCFCLCWV